MIVGLCKTQKILNVTMEEHCKIVNLSQRCSRNFPAFIESEWIDGMTEILGADTVDKLKYCETMLKIVPAHQIPTERVINGSSSH